MANTDFRWAVSEKKSINSALVIKFTDPRFWIFGYDLRSRTENNHMSYMKHPFSLQLSFCVYLNLMFKSNFAQAWLQISNTLGISFAHVRE